MVPMTFLVLVPTTFPVLETENNSLLKISLPLPAEPAYPAVALPQGPRWLGLDPLAEQCTQSSGIYNKSQNEPQGPAWRGLGILLGGIDGGLATQPLHQRPIFANFADTVCRYVEFLNFADTFRRYGWFLG